jgi:hypothetical protein
MNKPFKKPLHLTSPYMKGQRVRDAQYTLKTNRFGSFYKGKIDGVYGVETAKAANRARLLLGFAMKYVYLNVYGQQLHEYLRGPKHRGKRLKPVMIIRRKLRLKEEAKKNTVKLRALAIAHRNVGIREIPYGSNRQMFGSWYGFNGAAWCAIFVTYCFVQAGDKRTFRRGSRSAWSQWPLNMARSNAYGLSITYNPEPGDIVVYTHGQGHIGIFDKWIDRSRGHFQTVEGNTSVGNDSNGGIVMPRQRYVGDYMNPHFVRFS